LDQAQIIFAYTGMTDGGFATVVDGKEGGKNAVGGDVYVNVEYKDWGAGPGEWLYTTIMHETGHAVGLDHPHGGVLLTDSAQDNTDYSVMSYHGDPDGSGFGNYTFMLYDVSALQYLYGPNMNTNADDTVYDLSQYFKRNALIWDAGGIDTLDGFSLTEDVVLNLNDGAHSNVGTVTNLAIAFNTEIENARGGSGNDWLIGNEQDNVLMGGEGNDVLVGNRGNDRLIGGAGDDMLSLEGGGDVLVGGAGVDTLVATGDTTINLDSDNLYGLERVDATGEANDINVHLGDITDLSDNDSLYILGDDGIDTVHITGGERVGVVNVDGVDYVHYTDGDADLFVENTLVLNFR